MLHGFLKLHKFKSSSSTIFLVWSVTGCCWVGKMVVGDGLGLVGTSKRFVVREYHLNEIKLLS